MVERRYTDVELADLYDLFYPPEKRPDLAFYLPMVLGAEAVLDVGCGTGALLRMARHAGHRGRLCGVDPAPAMLERAGRTREVEWVAGDLTTATFREEFDLVIMTGHAFQVLIGDDEVRNALAAIATALRPGGRFAFETRNRARREWEEWAPGRITGVTTSGGTAVLMRDRVGEVAGDVVRFTTSFESSVWDEPKVSQATLRFFEATALAGFLEEAGLRIESQFGDWDARPLTAEAPEIITVARAACGPPGCTKTPD